MLSAFLRRTLISSGGAASGGGTKPPLSRYLRLILLLFAAGVVVVVMIVLMPVGSSRQSEEEVVRQSLRRIWTMGLDYQQQIQALASHPETDRVLSADPQWLLLKSRYTLNHATMRLYDQLLKGGARPEQVAKIKRDVAAFEDELSRVGAILGQCKQTAGIQIENYQP